mmetsp:Transcript_38637/g.90699  ORF Transcript_38637/g.90699 Transcript_38637/m.90699 type:complete len:285 (+) Transcript_38637:1059-1913(+)
MALGSWLWALPACLRVCRWRLPASEKALEGDLSRPRPPEMLKTLCPISITTPGRAGVRPRIKDSCQGREAFPAERRFSPQAKLDGRRILRQPLHLWAHPQLCPLPFDRRRLGRRHDWRNSHVLWRAGERHGGPLLRLPCFLGGRQEVRGGRRPYRPDARGLLHPRLRPPDVQIERARAQDGPLPALCHLHFGLRLPCGRDASEEAEKGCPTAANRAGTQAAVRACAGRGGLRSGLRPGDRSAEAHLLLVASEDLARTKGMGQAWGGGAGSRVPPACSAIPLIPF